MTADGGVEGALTLARRRLEASVAALEARLSQRAPADSLFSDDERERLEVELEGSRARERDLAAAASQASEALTRAIVDIRAALGTG